MYFPVWLRTLQFPRTFFHFQDVCLKILPVDRQGSFWAVGIQPSKILSLWNSSNDNVEALNELSTLESGMFWLFDLFGFFSPYTLGRNVMKLNLWALKGQCVCVCALVSILHCIQCFQMDAIMTPNKWLEMICEVSCWFYASTLSQVEWPIASCHHFMAV